MTVVKAQRVPKEERRTKTALDLIATFCYHFQQYKFHEARNIPLFRIRQMLRVARSEQSKMYYELTQIVASPHTSKGVAVKKLISKYEKEVNG